VRKAAEGLWKLLSKNRSLKLKDFALPCTRCLETHMCVRVDFLRWSKSTLKTEIKWQTKHQTRVSKLFWPKAT